MNKKKPQVLYGFWDYDLCPYMIGGIIERFTAKGNIIPKGYQGNAFKPIAIIPDEDGAKALEELKELRHRWDVAEKNMKLFYMNAARQLVNLPKIEPKK